MMDKTDLIMALNDQDGYWSHQKMVSDLVIMLHNSGQAIELLKALADGDTLERLAVELGIVWNLDPDTLLEAFRLALAKEGECIY